MNHGQFIATTPKDRAEIRAAYQAGESLASLASRFDVAVKTVINVIVLAGEEIRPVGRPRRLSDKERHCHKLESWRRWKARAKGKDKCAN